MYLKVSILYIIIVILLFIINKNPFNEGFQSKSPDVEMVIANYEEDIEWVNTVPSNIYNKITIYNKGRPKNYGSLIKKGAKIHALPNIGREGHTYLYHIIANYDNLADLTMFIPGSSMTFYQKKAQLDVIFDVLQTKRDSIIIGFTDPEYIENELNTFMIDEYEITSEENKKRNPGSILEPAEIRPFGKWINARFPGEKLTCIGYRGVAVASREDIQKRPREFYEGLIGELQTPNPEVGHYIERAWPLILSVDGDKCGGGNFSAF
jgi:hypothetical protein